MMLGCVTALTKTTKENGATICIPRSHKWGPERCPLDEEAIPAELAPGSALVFVGNLYHAGGGNITKLVSLSANGYQGLTTFQGRSSRDCGNLSVQALLPTG